MNIVTGVYEGFSKQYQCYLLVWFERFESLVNAIDREKQNKRWRREKKVWLIEQRSPTWGDLSKDW